MTEIFLELDTNCSDIILELDTNGTDIGLELDTNGRYIVLELDNPSITPTVELNALAMKRGEQAVYRPFERARPMYPYPPNMPPFDYRGISHVRQDNLSL